MQGSVKKFSKSAPCLTQPTGPDCANRHRPEGVLLPTATERGMRVRNGPHGMCSFDKRSLGIISTGKNGQLFFRSREAKSPTAFFWSPQGTCFHSNHNLGRCCLRVNYPRKIFSVGYQSWMGRNSTESESRTSLGLTEVEEIGSAVARGGSCQRQSCTLPW